MLSFSHILSQTAYWMLQFPHCLVTSHILNVMTPTTWIIFIHISKPWSMWQNLKSQKVKHYNFTANKYTASAGVFISLHPAVITMGLHRPAVAESLMVTFLRLKSPWYSKRPPYNCKNERKTNTSDDTTKTAIRNKHIRNTLMIKRQSNKTKY